jgi:hypothetical protein
VLGESLLTVDGQAIGVRSSVVAKKPEACQKFAELAAVAGSLLPENFYAQLGLKAGTQPALVWAITLPWLLSGIPNAFVERKEDGALVTIHNPYAASVRAIEHCQRAATKAMNAAQPVAKTKRLRPKNATKREIARLAHPLLAEHPDISLRAAAEILGCSKSLLQKVPAWKEHLRKKRERHQPKEKRAINLSDKMLNTMAAPVDRGPIDPALLENLIAEQGKDYEPSPFEKAQKRTRHRKIV